MSSASQTSIIITSAGFAAIAWHLWTLPSLWCYKQ